MIHIALKGLTSFYFLIYDEKSLILVDRFVVELEEACEYRTRNVCLPGIC